MKLRTVACALAATLVFPVAASAQPPPTPDFSPMAYFVGLWNCKFVKNPDPKLVGKTFSIAGATDPAGYWEILDLRNGRINITRDSDANHWTFIYLGNGGDYSVMTTPGWVGNTLTLTEVITYGSAPRGQARFVRLGDSKYRATYSAKTSTGLENYETGCTRV